MNLIRNNRASGKSGVIGDINVLTGMTLIENLSAIAVVTVRGHGIMMGHTALVMSTTIWKITTETESLGSNVSIQAYL